MVKKQFAVIGMGRFGQSIARNLADLGEQVLAIDIDEDRIDEIAPYVTHAVQADATDEKALNALGIRNFDVAVITIGTDIEASIFVTMLCKEFGVKYVVAKAQTDLHGKMLCKTGADKVVFPERDMGMRIAHNLSAANILDFLELSGDVRIMEIVAIDDWSEKTLIDLDFRGRYNINIIAIKKTSGEVNTSPRGKDVIEKGDLIVVIGSRVDVERIERAARE